MKLRRLITVAAPFLVLAGCAKTGPLRVSVAADVERPPKSLILFFVDGLDYGRFSALLVQGKLPNIKQRFVDGGVCVDHAITSIPSMTYPNAVALFTGQFPGHHDVVGNQWFDRRTLAYPNYITAAEYSAVNNHFRSRTLFEALPGHFSVNILANVARGATYTVDNHVAEGIGWYLGWYGRVNELASGGLEDAAALANRVKRWPSLITMYFPGLDQIGHETGSNSSAYDHELMAVDRQIGRVWEALARNNLDTITYGVLVTDHSHTATSKDRPLDLVCWLRQNRGLRIHEGRVRGDDYADRLDELNGYDAVLVDGSHRRCVLHLKGSGGWFASPTAQDVDLVLCAPKNGKRLCDVPGVGLVCSREAENRIGIVSSRGLAEVCRRATPSGNQYLLKHTPRQMIPPESDPLQYLADPELRSFVEAGWHSSREWLAATAGAKYPDFVPQIAEYFDSIRAGELLIFADEGWVFSGHGRGEHGAALAADMRIPMCFTGPGLKKGGRVPFARIVDVMPTIVELLEGSAPRDSDGPLDGLSLAAQLRADAP